MSLKIRLARGGSKKRPYYHVVVADARSPRDGAFVETIGHYSPLDPETIKIDAEKARLWLQRGAQPTEAVQRLFWRAGVTERPAHAQPGAAQATGETATATEKETEE